MGPPAIPNKQNAVAEQCYKYGTPNHFARDCWQPRGKSQRALLEIHCYQCQQQGHFALRCPGNEARGKRPALLSLHKLEEVFPVMKVKINGMDRRALVDSGCSLPVVSGMLSNRSTEAYRNSDSRQEVPSKPWC